MEGLTQKGLIFILRLSRSHNAGHFSPRVIVTNKQGQTYEATTDVVVENPEDLQAALNARLQGMLAALAKQDVEGASRLWRPESVMPSGMIGTYLPII